METEKTIPEKSFPEAEPSALSQEAHIITAQERQEFEEFRRQKRVAEARGLINKIELSASGCTFERAALRRAIKECEKLGIGGVCTLPYLVKAARTMLGAQSPVKVVALISPFGGTDTTDIKVRQIKRALRDGANAVEATACVPAIKEGSWGYVKREIKKLKRAARKSTLRINLEAPLLTADELTRLVSLVCDLSVPCVRTACGQFGSGADEENLKLIKSAVKDRALIKAEGAAEPARMATLLELGAGIVGSEAAVPLAQSILAAAEK